MRAPTAKMTNDEYCSLHLPKWGDQEWSLREKAWAINWEKYREKNFETEFTRNLSWDDSKLAVFEWYGKIGCPSRVLKAILDKPDGDLKIRMERKTK